MPLLRIQRYKVAALPLYTTYAQTLDVFTSGGKIEFVFGTGPTWTAGNWVFLTYNSTTVTQTNLDLFASVSPPIGFTAGAPQLDTANKYVTITLTAV